MRESTSRKMLAVVLGIIVGNGVFFLVGIVADRIYPTPPELLDPQTPEATALRVATAEATGLLLVLLGSALGGFFAGISWRCRCKGKNSLCHQCHRRTTLALWALYSLYVFYPARLWFPIGMLISFLLFSYLGGLVIMRSKKKDHRKLKESSMCSWGMRTRTGRDTTLNNGEIASLGA